MPAIQRGQPYPVSGGRWGLRYYDRSGQRCNTEEKFATKTEAYEHFRDVIEPRLCRGAPRRDLTLAELVEVYLERHAATNKRPRTISTLRDRLRHAIVAFGDESLTELERMSDEIAAWQAGLPPRAGHGIVQALRQVLDGAVRWGYITRNPAKLAGPNSKPPPRPPRPYTLAELELIAAELPTQWEPLPQFAAATGLRPQEWLAVERQDIDRRGGVLNVRRTVSSGEVVGLAKTSDSRRQVPLSPAALEALDRLPPRLDTPLLFPAERGGLLDIDNFRRRQWGPAIERGSVRKPARIYDLRSTFASNAIAAGIDVFEIAKVMGTSIEMIERHYGSLLSGAAAGIAQRLAAFEAEQRRPREEGFEDA